MLMGKGRILFRLLTFVFLILGLAWKRGFPLAAGTRRAKVEKTPFNLPYGNRTLIVLAAPSIWNSRQRASFHDIADFQISLAKAIHAEGENVLVLVGRHAMPYFDGRRELLRQHLPREALLEATLYDVNLRDFAPFGASHLTKFVYRNRNWSDLALKQVDDSMNKFLARHRIRVDRREQEMALSGADIVDNGARKAIVRNSVVEENRHRLTNWATQIKLGSVFKRILTIPLPAHQQEGSAQLRLDDLMSFIDEDVLAISSSFPSPNSSTNQTPVEIVRHEMERRFRRDITFIELPVAQRPSPNAVPSGNCGLYTAILPTPHRLYVPVFGNSPQHWTAGYSSATDKLALHSIRSNSRKKVVPINMPLEICAQGLSLRSLAWVVTGNAAGQLIEAAEEERRNRGNEIWWAKRRELRLS